MLVDIRNALYRAIYAGMKESNEDYSIVIFFRFMASYIRQLKPSSVNFFWDDSRHNVWRTKIYSEYKGNRDLKDREKVDLLLERQSEIVNEIAQICGCRNYFVSKQEADDLIYAFCKQNLGSKMIIVSSDGDFRQLVYSFRDVQLYNPMGKDGRIYESDGVNPIEVKCFMGEKTDNIPGYPGIGPVKSKKLVTDYDYRRKFLDDNGIGIYIRNKALIDLSLCPYTLRNMKVVINTMQKPVKYDISGIIKIIQKYKVKGLLGEMSTSLLPFKDLC
jgi:DNA polymerase-1